MKRASVALILTLALPFTLIACSDDGADIVAEPEVVASVPSPLATKNFGDVKLGGKIVGPLGTDVTSELSVGGRVIATMVSYVACPSQEIRDVVETVCVPADRDDGEVYTYVLKVTPVGIDGDLDMVPLTFRTAVPVTGFADLIGFDYTQASLALGETNMIDIERDEGVLVWTIDARDEWNDGEEITFFWQSVLPPAGPALAYTIETAAGNATGLGPFPTAVAPQESVTAE